MRKTNDEDTMPQGKQKDLKTCQTKMDHSFPRSRQYQILQDKSHLISTELVSSAADGILS